MNYYNENDPNMAAWLRELIKAKIIPDGEVDGQNIEDVRPADLSGFIQCHFFAGIGGWAEALTLSGWPEDRPVWTGSCPCQSFSTAGERKGFADERHLWPAWFHLIEQCRPPILFGEQVDAAIQFGWFDLVQTDLEAAGYAIASAIIPAAGVGAPHLRNRLWFVADALRSGRTQRRIISGAGPAARLRDIGGMEHADVWPRSVFRQRSKRIEHSAGEQEGIPGFTREQRTTGGFWSNADWVPCRDGKWRAIESGVFPLAHGVSARMAKLRGFSNAIVPQVAAEFITAFLDTE